MVWDSAQLWRDVRAHSWPRQKSKTWREEYRYLRNARMQQPVVLGGATCSEAVESMAEAEPGEMEAESDEIDKEESSEEGEEESRTADECKTAGNAGTS